MENQHMNEFNGNKEAQQYIKNLMLTSNFMC